MLNVLLGEIDIPFLYPEWDEVARAHKNVANTTETRVVTISGTSNTCSARS